MNTSTKYLLQKKIKNNHFLFSPHSFSEEIVEHKDRTDLFSIKNYFDCLNQDVSHFVNANDICTPILCVKDMVDVIPESFWENKNIKVLDPCCGNGNFHAYIRTKTDLSNLYFNEINEKRIKNLKKYFGNSINLTQQDFLTFSNENKFDLIVANPPYAKFMDADNRASKNHNLSRDFIEKALDIVKDGGYILFIVPNNWMSFSDRNFLPKKLSSYQFIHINIHGAKKYFPKVGSSFTWFLLKKTENKDDFIVENNYVISDKQKLKIKKDISFVPLYTSKIVESILDKTIRNDKLEKYNIETSSMLHHYTKKYLLNKKETKVYKYKLWHTPSQVSWSKEPHPFQNGYKVFLSLTNQYQIFIDNCGMTQSVAFIKCKNKKQAQEIKKELENDIYIFLNNLTRYGNFNNIRILQQLPILKDIKLTKDEIEFIKNFNKKYYAKK
ncbi:MAG: class I SAM-dependent methyltransferase [Alphaproteobacteria bacterium]|nr:class I SAM-dependent methyltransferase [Alphaproteobacteria bacterium]